MQEVWYFIWCVIMLTGEVWKLEGSGMRFLRVSSLGLSAIGIWLKIDLIVWLSILILCIEFVLQWRDIKRKNVKCESKIPLVIALGTLVMAIVIPICREPIVLSYVSLSLFFYGVIMAYKSKEKSQGTT